MLFSGGATNTPQPPQQYIILPLAKFCTIFDFSCFIVSICSKMVSKTPVSRSIKPENQTHMIENNKIRVTIEVGGWQVGDEGQCPETYIFETDSEGNIDDWAELLKKMLYCVGFANSNIEELFNEDV
jgi:hypothetical protein